MAMGWLTSEVFGTNGMTKSRFVLDTNAVIFLTIVLNATLLTADVKLLRLERHGFKVKSIG
jgi:hypothetical protein